MRVGCSGFARKGSIFGSPDFKEYKSFKEAYYAIVHNVSNLSNDGRRVLSKYYLRSY